MELGAGHVQGMAEAAHGMPFQQHADRLRVDKVVPLPPAIQECHCLAMDRLQFLPSRFQLRLQVFEVHARSAAGGFGNRAGLPLGVLHLLLGGGLFVLEPLGSCPAGLIILPLGSGKVALEAGTGLLAQGRLFGLGRGFLGLVAGRQDL